MLCSSTRLVSPQQAGGVVVVCSSSGTGMSEVADGRIFKKFNLAR